MKFQGIRLSCYRPDIDGLRAFAVLSVIIYHINREWLPSGFIGVDVFFVISGYLITGILHRNIVQGGFSYSGFMLRRALRILPATLFMIFVVVIFGAIYMLPVDVTSLSESAVASIFSLANVYFWIFLDNGYFAPTSDHVPLLHLWSLGVEEQFYIVWPWLLLLLTRLRWIGFVLAFMLAVGSFLVGDYYVIHDQSFAYYMLPSRAGQLLVGGGLYFLLLHSQNINFPRYLGHIVGLTGISILLGSVFLMIEEKHPGLISVLPVVAAAAVIAAGALGNNPVTALLSRKLPVSVGLISFSLYLWHWPVLAFYRYAYGDLDFPGGAICVLVMLASAIISYKYIEGPFKNGSNQKLPVAA
jgi:peptidoglycan/LPS O-acetylase OafA/YrhL